MLLMNQFGIIIQETTAGLNLQYSSPFLEINDPEIKQTIIDERILASQLSNLSDVYSVQITKNYKVYSLIVTNITDFVGRSGYYVIRLYAPRAVKLDDFENILSKIKEKYNSYSKANNYSTQNYDDILSSILIIENNKKEYLSIKSNTNCYCYFDETSSITTLSTIFNTKSVHLFNKLYAFNKTKAASNSIIESTGLKLFSNQELKEIIVINDFRILKELRVNDIDLDFNSNQTELNILCQSNDTITYRTVNDKKFLPVTSNPFYIQNAVKEERSHPSKRQHKNDSKYDQYGIYAIVGIFCIIILGLVWYISHDEENPSSDSEDQTSTTESTVEDDKNKPIDTSKKSEITFSFEGNTEDSVFKTESPKLEKYRFRFEDSKWQFKNTKGKNEYQDFYIEKIEEINRIDTLNFDASKQEELKTKLEEISGKLLQKKSEIKVKQTIPSPKSATKGKVKSTKVNAKQENGITPSTTTRDESDIKE